MKKIGYRVLAITAAILLPFGTQPNLVSAARGEGIEYDDEQNVTVVKLNSGDLSEVDFDYSDQQDNSAVLAEPSILSASNPNIALISANTNPQYASFGNFTLNPDFTRVLVYPVAYSKKTRKLILTFAASASSVDFGLVNSSNMGTLREWRASNLKVNEAYRFKMDIYSGENVCAMVHNCIMTSNVSFSNVTVESAFC